MFRGLRPCFLATLALAACLSAAGAQDKDASASTPPPRRLALVIGNAHYAADPLPTAVNDAGLVAQTLALAGFDVTAGADADKATLHKLVDNFLGKVRAAAGSETVVVTYFSGYGLQVDGDDFLVPIDARIPRDVDVAVEALRLSDLSRDLDATPAKARIFVYDLARATPFAKAGAPLASGLALVAASQGSLTAFNTAPGAVDAADAATYGTYARAFAEMFDTPGLPTNLLFDQLRLRVTQITNGSTVPWDDSKLDGALALAPADAGTPVDYVTTPDRPIAGLSPDVAFFLATARDRLDVYVDYLAAFAETPFAGRIQTMTAARREALVFAASVQANVADAYWTYMRFYPHGPHLFDARRRLAMIHAALEPPPRFDPVNFGTLGRPSPEEIEILAKRPLTFDDPAWIPLPSPPSGMIPPPPPDDIDLSVPPLAVAGVLPIPMPSQSARKTDPGTIRQPFVPGYGEILTRFRSGPGGATWMETSNAGGLISRTVTQSENDRRIVTQRNASDAIISRIVTTFGKNVVTTVQTGPTGGVLTKVVTQTDASGGHTMTISNSSNQVIATVDRDKNGVVTEMTRGPVAGDQTVVLKPKPGPNGSPEIEPIDKASPTIAPSRTPNRAAPAVPASGAGAPDGTSAPTPPTAEVPPPRELKVEPPPAPPPEAPPKPPVVPADKPSAPDNPLPPPKPNVETAPSSSAGSSSVPAVASPPLPPPRPALKPRATAPKSHRSSRRIAPRRGRDSARRRRH